MSRLSYRPVAGAMRRIVVAMVGRCLSVMSAVIRVATRYRLGGEQPNQEHEVEFHLLYSRGLFRNSSAGADPTRDG